MQKREVRNFTEKKTNILNLKSLYMSVKRIFLKDFLKIEWSLESEKRNKELSEKHIGKNNPKRKLYKNRTII